MRKKWTNLRLKVISNRTATLKGSFGETKLKVVNCYGPSQMIANKHKEIYETFLQQLKTSITTKNGKILVIQEDFIAKIGRCFQKLQDKGVSARGCKSNNGSLLNEFMVNREVVLSSEVRRRVHELGLARFQKGGFQGEQVGRKVKERRRCISNEICFF